MRYRGAGPTHVLAILAGLTSPQLQSGGAYDLTWRVPHDRAAVYEVFDGSSGARRGEFWLLGCELERRVGASDCRDLPYRYVFKPPKGKVKPGSRWEIKEFAFEGAPTETGVSPMEVVGRYRLRQVKPVRLNELFKAAFKAKKGPLEPVEAALVDAQLDIYRCNHVDQRGIVRAEQRPSAGLALLVAVRPSDGAVLAARHQWTGRYEAYTVISDPVVSKTTESAEILFTDKYIEINKESLKPRIDEAVLRGVRALKSMQAKDGRIADAHYPVGSAAGLGATAMSLMALMHSGVSLDDPVVKAGFAYLRGRKVIQSYDLSLCLMAVEAKYLPLGTIHEVESFSEEKAREEIRKKITKEDAAWATEMTRALIACQADCGMFGYDAGGSYPNFSSTQYSILGLKSSSRMGISVPPSTWRRTLSYISKSAVPSVNEINVLLHRRSGGTIERMTRPLGWSYMHPDPDASGSMTTAALSTMAICESELARAKEWTDQDSRMFDELALGAAAWLQEKYSIRSSPEEGCGWAPAMLFYYLYGLERACILWELEKIGGHDWFLEGTTMILSWQNPDGSWTSRRDARVIDTAWALLFLKRATIPVDTGGRPRIATIDNSTRAMEPTRRP